MVFSGVFYEFQTQTYCATDMYGDLIRGNVLQSATETASINNSIASDIILITRQ